MEGGTVNNPVSGAAAKEAHAEGDTIHSSRPGAKAIAAAMMGAITGEEGQEVMINASPVAPDVDPPVVSGTPPAAPRTPAEAVPGVEATPTPQEGVITPPEGPVELEVDGVAVTQELLDTLAEVGFDLPVDVESLRAAPPEVHAVVLPVIGQMIQAANETLEAAVRVEELTTEKAALSQKMSEEGDKLILSLALAQPEMFKQVAEVFDRMENDPGFRQMVINELQSEAKLAEAERREASLDYRQREVKARQVTGHTRRTARALGLDPNVALKHVATHIKATESKDIPISRIEPLLRELAASQGGRAKVSFAPRTPEHATPESQAAAAGANQGSVGDATPGVDAPPAERTRGIRSKLSGIVKAASQKYDTSQ